MKLDYTHGAPRRLGALGAILLMTQLAACGGGGGGGDDDTPPPPPATVALTFKGTVTDAPIANAAVTVKVGDQSFTTTADANGVYSIEVEIEEDDADGFVSLSARGAGDQAFVEFTSLAGSFAALLEQAGADEILTAAENFSVQVTNVSTAEAVLLAQANGGQPVNSDALLNSLGSAVNGQDVLDLATAIKLAVDSAAEYPLPEGYTSILALASDAEARADFIAAAAAQDAAAFSETQSAIAGDPALTQPVAAADVPASMTAALLSTDLGFTFNYNNRVSAFGFAQDGTGSLSGGSFNVATTWEVEGSSINVSFAEPVETVSFDVENCDGTIGQVEAHYVSNGLTLNLLSARTLAITETSTISYPGCPSLETRTVTATSARTLLADEDFQPQTNADLAGLTHTFYVYDAGQGDVIAEVADIEANGTGTTHLLGLSFTWALTADGRTINVSFSDGSEARYRVLRQIDTFVDDLFYEIDTDDGRYVDAGAQIEVDPVFETVIDAADVPGRYYQFGIGNEQAPAAGIKGFRLRFDAGGVGSQEDDILEEGEVVTFDGSNTPSYLTRWTVEEGNLVVRRSYDYVSEAYNCQGGPSCIVFDERVIVPLVESDEGRFYVLELRRSNNNGITESTPRTSLARYYDFEPLAATKAARPRAAAAKPQTTRGALPH